MGLAWKVCETGRPACPRARRHARSACVPADSEPDGGEAGPSWSHSPCSDHGPALEREYAQFAELMGAAAKRRCPLPSSPTRRGASE